MNFLFLGQKYTNPRTVIGLIAASTACSLILNWYGLTLGITNVLPHLLYIPIILTAYYYPRWGVAFTTGLSLAYGIIVWQFFLPGSDILFSALARILVFITIAAVVSYLSGRLQHDANLSQRLASIVESSNDAIVGQTMDGIITEWNHGAERIYGYKPSEMIGRRVNLLFPPEVPDELPRLIDKIFRGERIERFETERITKNGIRIQVSLSLSPIKNVQGQIVGISTTVNDISEKKRMQDQILRAKTEWELTFDAVPDLIAIIDQRNHILQVNKAMTERLGASREDIVGRACYQVVHHTMMPPGFCPHQMLLSDGKEHSLEIREERLKADFLVTASPLHDSHGMIIGSVHVMHDITERKRAETALQLALKKLNMLSSITRHDIQNQLMAMRAYLGFLKEKITDPGLLGFVGKEETAIEAISRQIEFTQHYENIGVHAPQWQDVCAIIRSSASQLSTDTISLEVTFSGIEVFADPLIGKVFYNLMENSFRHGGNITRITFSFERMNGDAKITYRDDGTGIPVDDKEQIFRKGFGKHTGLGLFLTREILSITGITIRENGEPGKGVQFEIVIPHDMHRISSDSKVAL
ncbi:MAG TPA: PAS domain S-box protein [Methanoregula sp.]|nr:PAS domain S-box protein [Methanoregula sp.]